MNWEERVERASMITQEIRIFLFSLVFISCDSQLEDDPIPVAFFDDIVVNLNFPEYIDLRRDDGVVALNEPSAGVRGIILYRQSASVYFAYERNCSFRPNEACATIDIHSSGLFLIDSCCGSTFDLSSGTPTGGPAWRPLVRYNAQIDGSLLTITDQIVN